MPPDPSNAGIELPNPGTQPQPQLTPNFGANASTFAKHPWTSQVLLAVVMLCGGAMGGQFIWDDNADAIRELQIEVKLMRKDMDRQAEVWEVVEKNEAELAQVQLLKQSLDSLGKAQDSMDKRLEAVEKAQWGKTNSKWKNDYQKWDNRQPSE